MYFLKLHLCISFCLVKTKPTIYYSCITVIPYILCVLDDQSSWSQNKCLPVTHSSPYFCFCVGLGHCVHPVLSSGTCRPFLNVSFRRASSAEIQKKRGNRRTIAPKKHGMTKWKSFTHFHTFLCLLEKVFRLGGEKNKECRLCFFTLLACVCV